MILKRKIPCIHMHLHMNSIKKHNVVLTITWTIHLYKRHVVNKYHKFKSLFKTFIHSLFIIQLKTPYWYIHWIHLYISFYLVVVAGKIMISVITLYCLRPAARYYCIIVYLHFQTCSHIFVLLFTCTSKSFLRV